MKVTQSCPTLCNPMNYTVHGILQARILEWVAFPFSRGSSQPRDQPGSPTCRWILYQLSHQGNPRILEWVAYPFSKGSSQLGNQTGVSCIAGRFFTNWAIREAHIFILKKHKNGILSTKDSYIFLMVDPLVSWRPLISVHVNCFCIFVFNSAFRTLCQ